MSTASKPDFGYPKKKIGKGNPYYCCASCGISDPEINGNLKNHLPSCSYRLSKENTAIKSKLSDLTVEEKETILSLLGWEIQCQSPLEVSDNEGNFASGFAAKIVID